MATIKSYTDLEQSKVLAKILPMESADMFHFIHGDNNSETVGFGYKKEVAEFYSKTKLEYIPCWSLTALLGVLPDDCCGIDKENGKYVASYVVSNEGGTYISDNPVDACVSMIEYLHKLKML